ncbi:hypothetical protein M5689_000910 [Euphorbia peplus]|nr:hypothetical protein M5689_000910 [Euphorbia peplus]
MEYNEDGDEMDEDINEDRDEMEDDINDGDEGKGEGDYVTEEIDGLEEAEEDEDDDEDIDTINEDGFADLGYDEDREETDEELEEEDDNVVIPSSPSQITNPSSSFFSSFFSLYLQNIDHIPYFVIPYQFVLIDNVIWDPSKEFV